MMNSKNLIYHKRLCDSKIFIISIDYPCDVSTADLTFTLVKSKHSDSNIWLTSLSTSFLPIFAHSLD